MPNSLYPLFIFFEGFPNWEGRVGLDPNMYDVTLLDLFFLKSSLSNKCWILNIVLKMSSDVLKFTP